MRKSLIVVFLVFAVTCLLLSGCARDNAIETNRNTIAADSSVLLINAYTEPAQEEWSAGGEYLLYNSFRSRRLRVFKSQQMAYYIDNRYIMTCLSPNGKSFIAGYEDNDTFYIDLYDTESKEKQTIFTCSNVSHYYPIRWNKDGIYMYKRIRMDNGNYANTNKLYRMETMENWCIEPVWEYGPDDDDITMSEYDDSFSSTNCNADCRIFDVLDVWDNTVLYYYYDGVSKTYNYYQLDTQETSTVSAPFVFTPLQEEFGLRFLSSTDRIICTTTRNGKYQVAIFEGEEVNVVCDGLFRVANESGFVCLRNNDNRRAYFYEKHLSR